MTNLRGGTVRNVTNAKGFHLRRSAIHRHNTIKGRKVQTRWCDRPNELARDGLVIVLQYVVERLQIIGQVRLEQHFLACGRMFEAQLGSMEGLSA